MIKRFCFIGHVDSGKSSFSGHLLKLVGHTDEHKFNEIKRKCEADKTMYQLYSRILDVCEEEQVKGKTHEFDAIKFTYNDYPYELIDTPGHKMYIRQMIRGVSVFESEDIIGCLLLSAAKGEFESGWIKGQTKEDIIIARSLGINKLIVLVNKMDLVEWDQSIFDDIVKTTSPFIKDGCQYKEVYFIPVSAYNGTGIVDETGMPSWYTCSGNGPFMGILNKIQTKSKKEIDVNTLTFNDKFNQFLSEVKIFHCDNIITSGFKCIVHYTGEEYECEVEKIIGKHMLKKKDAGKIIMICDKEIQAKYPSNRFIIRSGSNTIGYGKILKTKNQ